MAQIVRLGILDPEDRVRIAHVHGGKRTQDRRVGRPELEVDRACIGHFPRQRNLVPAKARRAHVDREQLFAGAPASDQAGRSFEIKRRPARLGADERGHAAHAITASARLRPVIVVNPYGSVTTAAPRIKRQELVVGLLARGGARLIRRDRARRMPQIDDHDLVADTVHLDEIPICQRAHDKARMCRTYMRTQVSCASRGRRPKAAVLNSIGDEENLGHHASSEASVRTWRI